MDSTQMKRGHFRIWRFLALLFITWLGQPAGDLPAYFSDNALGVRPAGMSGAFTAVADDTHAILYNPAGFARLQGTELNGMYAALFPDLDLRLPSGESDRTGYSFLALGWGGAPAVGGFGLGWTQLHSGLYQENIFSLAYGRSLWKEYGLDAGVSLKGLQWAVSRTEYMASALPGQQKWVFNADVGIMANPLRGFQVGFSVGNIAPVDAGLTMEERMPAIFKAGAGYLRDFSGQTVHSLLTAIEFTLRNRQVNLKLGAEARLLQPGLAVRAGIDFDQATFGLGYRFWPQAAVWQLEADYAYAYPFHLADTAGSHRLGLIARMNRTQPVVSSTPAATPAAALPSAPPELTPVPTPAPAPQINVGYELDVLSATSQPEETREKIEILKNDLQNKGHVILRFSGFAAFSDVLQAFQKGEIDAAVVRGVKLREISRLGRATPIFVLDMQPQVAKTYCLVACPGHTLEDVLKRKVRKLGYLQPEALDAAEMAFQTLPAYQPGRMFAEPQRLETLSAGIFALKVMAIDLMIVEEKDLMPHAREVNLVKRHAAPTLIIIARRTPELEKIIPLAVQWPQDPKIQPVLKYFQIRQLSLRNFK